MNFLSETKEKLKEWGKTFDEVKWIGTNKYYIDTNDFIDLADICYDNSWGAPKVATNLKIVGDNWWLERHEYDGSEWWEYKECPKKPKNKLYPKTLFAEYSVGWETLEQANGIEKLYEDLELEEE